jgi:hypothetical protein
MKLVKVALIAAMLVVPMIGTAAKKCAVAEPACTPCEMVAPCIPDCLNPCKMVSCIVAVPCKVVKCVASKCPVLNCLPCFSSPCAPCGPAPCAPVCK